MTIKPHYAFDCIRADEVAECWEGVPKDLYTKIWSKIVPHQRPFPNIEDSGPHDHIGHENLASYWDFFTPSEQELLNNLARKNV